MSGMLPLAGAATTPLTLPVGAPGRTMSENSGVFWFWAAATLVAEMWGAVSEAAGRADSTKIVVRAPTKE